MGFHGFHSGPLHSFKVPLEKVQPGTARAVGELRHDGPGNWKTPENFKNVGWEGNRSRIYFGALVRDDTSPRADGWGLAALGRQR